MKAVIIIPTYNEEGHIEDTINKIEQFNTKSERHNIHILVYDSHSTDKTATIVQSLQQRYDNITLLTEQAKTGLGAAYAKAMRYVIDHLDADIVVEYDADGSHQPCYLLQMLDAINQGADVVVGSRYIKGGKIDANWGWHRHLISRVGNGIARFFLTRRFFDFTSGYRATRVSMLKKVPFENLLSKSYAYKLHLFWELYQVGSDIVEIPITFIDRQYGVSKFPKNNIIESLKVVILLRLRVLRAGLLGK